MVRLDPGLSGAVVRPSNELYKQPDGSIRQGVNLTLTPEQFEQYRTGYRCISCHETQETPFPEECSFSYCRFPMKDKQMEWLSRGHHGEVDLWPDREEESPIWTPNG